MLTDISLENKSQSTTEISNKPVATSQLHHVENHTLFIKSNLGVIPENIPKSRQTVLRKYFKRHIDFGLVLLIQ